jgi:hypothetical protein
VRVGGNFIATNSLAIREVVLRDVGIAMSPTFVVGDDLRAGRLKALFTDYEALGTFGSHINAVYLPNRYLSPKVRAFVDFFVERFGPQPYWDQGLALAGVADTAITSGTPETAPIPGPAIDAPAPAARRAVPRRTKAA